MRDPGPAFFLYETSLKKTSHFWYNEIRTMFHCVQKCNLIFSPVETYLNPQRSSRRPPS